MKFEVIVRNVHKMWIDANTPEMAYRGVACWFSPRTLVTIRNVETNKRDIYSHELDKSGNLLEIIQH